MDVRFHVYFVEQHNFFWVSLLHAVGWISQCGSYSAPTELGSWAWGFSPCTRTWHTLQGRVKNARWLQKACVNNTFSFSPSSAWLHSKPGLLAPTIRGRILLWFIPSSSTEPKEDRENSEVDLQGKQPPDKQTAVFYFWTGLIQSRNIAEGTACWHFQGYFLRSGNEMPAAVSCCIF